MSEQIGRDMYFFTADLHFGEEEIIARESRPFGNMKEMEDAFVNNVNKVASIEDTLYVLGDWINYNFLYQSDISIFGIVKRLAPQVILIMGNNEQRLLKDVFNGDLEAMRKAVTGMGFKDLLTEADVEFGGETFHLIHQPVDHKEGCMNLFGHTHRGTGLWKSFGLNVGIDMNYFRPFSETEILRLLKQKREWMDNDPNVLCR